MSVQIKDFGKDHWSLLGYVETLCVDSSNGGVGKIDRERMRCNPAAHPHLVGFRTERDGMGWKAVYGTRLAGFFVEGEKQNTKRRLGDHDDWHCLQDLEDAGLVDWISAVNGFVTLTELGIRVSNALRAHKAKGGAFGTFSWKEGANGVRTR